MAFFNIVLCIFHGGADVSIYSRRKDRILFIKYRLVFPGCLSRSVKIESSPPFHPIGQKWNQYEGWPDEVILSLVQITVV